MVFFSWLMGRPLSTRASHRFAAVLALILGVGCGDAGAGPGPAKGGAGGTDGSTGATGTGGSGTGGTTGGTTGGSAGSAVSGAAATGGEGKSTSSGGSSASGAAVASGGMPTGAAGQPGTGGTDAAGQGDGGTSGGGAGGEAAGGGAGMAMAGGADGTDVIVTIKNGDYWLDSDGNRIEAHGAGLIFTEGAWYWIGEDKSANSGGFKAVNCYRSTDLSNWEFRHALITKQSSTDLAASDRIIERPKVIYNDTTKKYVMWLHWEGQNYATAEAGVFTSDTVDGDYTQVRHFQPNGRMSRDDTLFKDDDGKAYFLSASNENADLSLYSLSDDYTNMKAQLSTLWAGSYREAPAIMRTADHYFIVNSAATNWDPNQQKFSSATSLNGPWSALANVGDATGFDTQTAFIIPVKGTKTTTYIYAGDRWQDPDLKSSKYIWLPLKISGGTKLVMDWYDTWQLDVTTGEWSAAGQKDGYLSQAGWELVSVDSEETAGEDGQATNAFDGSSSTFWHTQWQDAQPPPPHELVIDLGATYSLTGMRYTPRNDGNQNGMVNAYELYVSDSTADFGVAVKTGSFGSSTAPTTVTFSAKTGRYIRFRALSEVSGMPYTSVAEIDVAGTPM